ncbi:hypothetical protein PF005_g17940 [Phytophthora fragariae]|uniref:Uncharacterized protein n=1 Tax=Phytophthora fragariae TaxID=53985 RepID=A0A6A3IZ45_9STRA|nr:hypothetical protein PF003_g1067 [Phytophthora fragariae]KAE8947767.1 hypothetical protein PF009_g2641 [Phytophthora fragariae]KAE8987321.1 hypothetical protein PF011_g19624 [Phytophthora fragariae]KAE9086444.1 hypothetical protein PF007_g20772 [Phytophthora fragariae]KAE9086512.1 hypothetical protein PF010_g20057 [Phytophthora fragariae]
MDGGRGGGGRGKDKKAKAAKKKAAAAAAAAQAQAQAAQAAHKKPHHSGKKVGASVQVVAVSKAATSTEAKAASGGPHDQSMTKSKAKRMRLKKAAAHALVKKQTALDTDKQHKKTPTAGASSAASPKTKNVAVLTPPPAAEAAKPHVVSLTGGKKKKRKRNALVAEENEAPAASMGLQREEKKTVAVVGHSSVASPSAAAKGKSLKPTMASPKRKIAQLGSAAQEQRAQKEGGVALATASSKGDVVASPRKIAKKMKLKAEAPVGIKAATAVTKREAQVAAKNLQAKDPATTDGENQVVAKKLQAKKAVQQEQKPAVNVMSPVTTSVKAETATKKRTIVQVNTSVKKPISNQQLPESSGQGNKNRDLAPKTSSENEAVATSHKATKRGLTQAAAMIPSTTTTGDKPAVTKPAPFREIVPAVSPEPAHGDSTSSISTTARVTHNKSDPQGSVPTPTSGAVQVRPSTPADTIVATPTTKETSKIAVSERVKATVTSPALVPSGDLKRRRSIDQASVNAFAVQPPAKRSAGTTNAAVVQSSNARQTEPRDPRLSTPNCSSDQVSSLQTGSAIPTSHCERPADTPDTFKVTHKESATPRLTPPVKMAVAVAQNVVQAPAKKTFSARIDATSSNATSQPKPVLKAEAMPSTTAPKEAKTDLVSSDLVSSTSRKVDIIMDSHSYVQKMMHGEMAKTGDSRGGLSAEPTVTLPPRPRNAWGASFGLVPPSTAVTSAPRTLSTTPLSSWFLSKGCANFVKKVHFSDDDDDNNGSSDDDDIPTLPRGTENTSPKRRTAFVKKNAFLESLKTQSNWRSWYGNVDMLNLLDPPLAHVPEKLQMHNVTPLQLPEATEIRAAGKRANDLEMLERDIRREKQRGSAFSEQLLMMLQGKTVSGKPLEEEYNTILH